MMIGGGLLVCGRGGVHAVAAFLYGGGLRDWPCLGGADGLQHARRSHALAGQGQQQQPDEQCAQDGFHALILAWGRMPGRRRVFQALDRRFHLVDAHAAPPSASDPIPLSAMVAAVVDMIVDVSNQV